ncbi:MAG: rane-bound lytic murein transglycosylase [Tenuifilum sp.]|jgi:membrane-bound lytic murein transglycosylase F|uniref:transporter substrate-binding domain-containing protein n=1 Tax=Tenuifilum sp. TaxID=2760880 RepID=UPI0024AC160E|nr:transporter substrate-binding domain-containing protein [Tenuifilum sp.]MDI3526805.1 rane-bound lytic murein transglycosylase [Tenuifilum sp.]
MVRFFNVFFRGLIFLAFLLLFSCLTNERSNNDSVEFQRDLADILVDGKIVAVTDYDAISYFIYKGKPMGYQYDMLRDLATYLGVKLEIITESDIDKSFELLKSGKVDIIASSLAITAPRKSEVDFTLPHGQTSQVLVQRFDENGVKVKQPLDLAGKIVYVQKSSSGAQRLKNLKDEIGRDITIVELPNYDADKLIELVSTGEIDYVVCDQSVAQVKENFYKNINIDVQIGFPQEIAWAVRKTSPELRGKINTWLEGYLKTAHYKRIERRYFSENRFNKRASSDYFYIYTGKISPWDEYFKKYSKEINFDWRLLASLVYQESRFNHNAQSKVGAKGLMQFMPATAKFFGISHNEKPEEQIKAGVKYIKWLDEKWAKYGVPKEERIKFVLASYNAGIGHVIDARNLAQKYGKNPNVWDNNVEYFIRHKYDFAHDPVVKYGSLKGTETYLYVKEIMDRYQHYKNIIGE